jgi:two-component sensor histidine kinase/CHASE3 domain sensor protein
MGATMTFPIGADRRTVPRWILGRKAASQFGAIVFLAAISFAASALIMNRTWDARDWVRNSREVQLQIDRFVWDLMMLQQATQAHALNPDSEWSRGFSRLRDGVRDDLAQTARLIGNNPYLQQRVADLSVAFAVYLGNLEQVLAKGAGVETDPDRALALTVDVTRVSGLTAQMREHEDGVLAQRTSRADTLLAILLLTLSFSAALIAFLVAFAARSINRALRERETVLSQKDGELAAKDVMMREIDHRVRNSLNLVYNLMMFQHRRTIDAAARRLLNEAANQVLVVARVHERLYKYGSMEAVELGDYLRDLCRDVASFSLPAEAQAAIQLHSARAEEAIWLGLIVVELVTNAVKYGKPTLQSPIVVGVSPDEKELRVVVSDGGAGLPTGFDLQTSKGLGMQVVLLLVRQLHATLEVDPAWAGTRFILTVPLAAARQMKRNDLRQTDQAA